MKKTKFLALLLAAMSFLAVSCNPDTTEDEKKPGGKPTVTGIPFESCKIVDNGVAENGTNHNYLITLAIGDTSIVVVDLVAPAGENGQLAAGTYSVDNGNIKPATVDAPTNGTYYATVTADGVTLIIPVKASLYVDYTAEGVIDLLAMFTQCVDATNKSTFPVNASYAGAYTFSQGTPYSVCMLTNVGAADSGKSKFTIRLANLDAEGYLTDYMNIELVAPEQASDRSIAAGTYTIAAGEILAGDYTKPTEKSFFMGTNSMSMTTSFPSEATLTIAYDGSGNISIYSVFSKGKDNNGKDSSVISGSYNGEYTVYGTAVSDTLSNAIQAEAYYWGFFDDGSGVYTVVLYNLAYLYMVNGYEPIDQNGNSLLPAKSIVFDIIGTDMGVEAIPYGTYDLDPLAFGYTNTVSTATYTHYASYDSFDPEKGFVGLKGYEDELTDGTFKMVPNGSTTDQDGNTIPLYNFDITAAGSYGQYTIKSQSLPVIIMDATEDPGEGGSTETLSEISTAYAVYYGPMEFDGGVTPSMWGLQFINGTPKTETSSMLYIEQIFSTNNSSFADGLPSGSYRVMTDANGLDVTDEFTVYPGWFDQNQGQVGGATYWKGYNPQTETYEGLYDTIIDGSLDITNNGDGTYQININMNGYYNYNNIVGSYTGAIDFYDASSASQQVRTQAINTKAFELQSDKAKVVGNERVRMLDNNQLNLKIRK